MPALLPTEHIATVTWLGCVESRATSLRASTRNQVDVTFEGFAGEDHGGVTRASCSRVSAQYQVGTTIRNVRQLSIVSAEELALIATEMGIEEFDPSWIGASIVVEGIEDFSHIPPSSRLQGPDGATLVVDMQNRPCVFPGKVIEEDAPGFGPAFKPAAAGRRGVTAWVECEGRLQVGHKMRLHVPDQRTWSLQGI